MKPKKCTVKKLFLRKVTVTSLDNTAQSSVHAGETNSNLADCKETYGCACMTITNTTVVDTYLCPPPTSP